MINAIYCKIFVFYDDLQIYAVFYSMNIFILLCVQSVAQIAAVLSPENLKLAWLYGFLFHWIMVLLGNSIIRLKDLHYSLQMVSAISYMKYSYTSILLIIYGFNRCSDDQFSAILYDNEINDRQFWPNIIFFLILIFIYKLFAITILMFKTHDSFNRKSNSISQKSNNFEYAHHDQLIRFYF